MNRQPNAAAPSVFNTNNNAISVNGSSSNNQHEVVGEFPDDFPDDDDAFGDDDDIFMEIDETELIEVSSNSNISSNNRSSNRTRNSTQSASNAETQRIIESENRFNSASVPPLQLQSDIGVRSLRSGNQPQTSKRQVLSSSSSSAESIVNTKPKKFNPPTKVARYDSGPSTSTSANTAPKSVNVVQTKISDFSSNLGGFKNARTLLPPSKAKPKQLKIDGYMKPMPVIIKPPTPKNTPTRIPRIDGVDVDVQSTSDANGEDDSINYLPEDEDIMETIEDSFAAELERIQNESTLLVEPELLANDLPVPAHKVFPPTGVVKPTCSTSRHVSFPISVSKNPYVYLKQVLDQWDSLAENRRIVKVKACIATVISNIQVVDGNWTLAVSINDGTGSMNCKISSEILNEIIGFSPTEMKQMKATRTPEAKEKIANVSQVV
jgi:hypothetical protein